MRQRSLLLALVVAGGLALSGCLGAPIEPAGSAPLPAGHDEHHETDASPAEPLGTPDVILEAHAGMPEDDLEIHPGTLRVPLGSVVEVRVENLGRSAHTFTLHAFDADTGTLAPGEEGTVAFRADKAGRFEIMCDVPGHYQAGMKSIIEVAA